MVFENLRLVLPSPSPCASLLTSLIPARFELIELDSSHQQALHRLPQPGGGWTEVTFPSSSLAHVSRVALENETFPSALLPLLMGPLLSTSDSL